MAPMELVAEAAVLMGYYNDQSFSFYLFYFTAQHKLVIEIKDIELPFFISNSSTTTVA